MFCVIPLLSPVQLPVAIADSTLCENNVDFAIIFIEKNFFLFVDFCPFSVFGILIKRLIELLDGRLRRGCSWLPMVFIGASVETVVWPSGRLAYARLNEIERLSAYSAIIHKLF